MTSTFTKRMFAIGTVEGHKMSRRTLHGMVRQFRALKRLGKVLPVRLDHHADGEEPIARRDFRRMAVSDGRIMGYISGLSMAPSGRALTCTVRFVRKRGRQIATSDRLGLSPVLVNPSRGPEGELLGDVACMDLCRPGDVTQGPFTPITRMATRPTKKRKGPRPMKKAKRMSEVKMPDLSDQQIAVLKKLDSIRKEIETIDWWGGAIRMLWPSQANEILGTSVHEDSDVKETQPDFAALSLDEGLTSEGREVTAIEAREFVDEQASRFGGMIKWHI